MYNPYNHLERPPVRVGPLLLLRRLHEAEEEVFGQLVWRVHLEEQVDEDLEAGEVNVLQRGDFSRMLSRLAVPTSTLPREILSVSK